MNHEKIEEIYESYINGQMKQMVSQIKEYEQNPDVSFWEDLNTYMNDWTPVLKYRTLLEIVSLYINVGK